MRRPIQRRVLSFLAETEDDLDKLIRSNTRKERVLKVERRQTDQFGVKVAYMARVTIQA